MYFIIPIDLQYQTIFDFCGYYNESFDIDLSGRAPRKILFPKLTQVSPNKAWNWYFGYL